MPKGENSPFKPGHKLGAPKKYTRKLAAQPITLRVFEDQYDRLKAIPELQQRLREMCDEFLSKLHSG